MSSRLRHLIYKKVTQSADSSKLPLFSRLALQHDAASELFRFTLPLRTKLFDLRANTESLLQKNGNKALENTSITREKERDWITFTVDRNILIKDILDSNKDEVLVPPVDDANKRIVIDFSSPNIAKPFHVGHLRSTIIGNYLANLNKFLHNDVVKINYLGDWGTQIGLIKIGMDLTNITVDTLKSNPIHELYKAYVHANTLCATDLSILHRAREICAKLESGDAEMLKDWEKFKIFTTTELKKIYSRLGITFDEYHWESAYRASNLQPILDEMLKKKIANKYSDGKIAINCGREYILLKSDGSTCYLIRDIAAAIDRAEKYNFDAMYYVVDLSQFEHFQAVIGALQKLGKPWADRLHHVKFGKIQGMSTRKGTAIMLSDILDEARTAMQESQKQTRTTKVNFDVDDNSAEILGMSALIINDLKMRWIRSYEFTWDRALDVQGETGMRLQYSHCRLVSLEENSGASLPDECDPTLLRESIVNELVATIGQFDEAVVESYRNVESHYLARYLFRLSHTVNRAFKELQVKDQPADLASQRLLLFHVAKNVLNRGMKLLGIVPLNKM